MKKREDIVRTQTDVGPRRMDRRVLRTRKSILDAFERLIMERGLGDISVSDIAREADIDRKTFYTHFGSVEGLLDAIADDMVRGILDEVDEALARDASVDGVASADEPFVVALREFFSAVARSIYSNFQVNRKLIENIPSEALLERVRRPLERELMARRYAAPFVRGIPAGDLDYLMAFELSGVLALYRRTVLSGEEDQEALERVGAIANVLVSQGLAGLERSFAPDDARGNR